MIKQYLLDSADVVNSIPVGVTVIIIDSGKIRQSNRKLTQHTLENI